MKFQINEFFKVLELFQRWQSVQWVRQTVPCSRCGDSEGAVADRGESHARYNQLRSWWRCLHYGTIQIDVHLLTYLYVTVVGHGAGSLKKAETAIFLVFSLLLLWRFLSAVSMLCQGPYPCKAITRMDWKTSSVWVIILKYIIVRNTFVARFFVYWMLTCPNYRFT